MLINIKILNGFINNMEIKPTYVTFEQAKLLKEKGFDEYCQASFKPSDNTFQKIPSQNSIFSAITAPEQWQVVEWLRVKHNIFINVKRSTRFKDGKSLVYYYGVAHTEHTEQFDYNGYETPQEAISSVIDYILKNLI